jgi:hypothetical protein
MDTEVVVGAGGSSAAGEAAEEEADELESNEAEVEFERRGGTFSHRNTPLLAGPILLSTEG